MRFAVGCRLVWELGSLFALLGVATAHLHTFLDVCRHNDVKVSCVPACPRICMDYIMVRKCKPVTCTPGCACKEGWVRKGSTTGMCIRRSSCRRWIV